MAAKKQNRLSGFVLSTKANFFISLNLVVVIWIVRH